MKLLLPLLLLLVPLASAASLQDFPDAFGAEGIRNATIVLGSAAGPKDTTLVINYIVPLFPSTEDSGITLDTDPIVPGRRIIIGAPCQNTVVAEALKHSECELFVTGEGYIAMTPSGDLIISGKDSEGLEKAIKAVIEQNSQMPSDGYLVHGTAVPYHLVQKSLSELASAPKPEATYVPPATSPTTPPIEVVSKPDPEVEAEPIAAPILAPVTQPEPEQSTATPETLESETIPPPEENLNIIQKILRFLRNLFLKPE